MSDKVEFLYLSQEDVIAAGGLEMTETVEMIETSFRPEDPSFHLPPGHPPGNPAPSQHRRSPV